MGKLFKDMQEAVAADPSLGTTPISEGLPGAAFELMASVQAEWMLTWAQSPPLNTHFALPLRPPSTL